MAVPARAMAEEANGSSAAGESSAISKIRSRSLLSSIAVPHGPIRSIIIPGEMLESRGRSVEKELKESEDGNKGNRR